MKRINFQKRLLLITICFGVLSVACEKHLNEPSDKSLAIITNLDDLQALFDAQLMHIAPNANLVSSDNYYLMDDGWESLSSEQEQRMYVWAENNVFRPGLNDWTNLYTAIYYANTILEHLQGFEMNPNNETRWRDIKGQALVFRAVSFLDAAQIWALTYDETSAQTDAGIPLRVQSDFNIPSIRANLQQTYEQIINDLQEAIPLLPVTPAAKVRPSKPAAYGLLARTYLWMRDYSKAKLYADSCLMLSNELMDYNQLNVSVNFPIPRHNVEVIFERAVGPGQILGVNRAKIPLSLFDSYDEDDLRRSIFFEKDNDGFISFRGSYYGGTSFHTGVTTDEMYITRAECLARDNKIEDSLQDLNTVLEKRWRQDEFTPYSALSANEALNLILEERRKQLLFRGLRWMDIKRLNKEGANISLIRELKGEIYTLPANSPNFALPLPDDLLIYFQ